MEYRLFEKDGIRVIEGLADKPLLRDVGEINDLFALCYEQEADRVLLHGANLPEGFFDLSTRVAGELLQKFRTYNTRLAIVKPADWPVSRHFGEMAAEEGRGSAFRLFTDPLSAEEWLVGDG